MPAEGSSPSPGSGPWRSPGYPGADIYPPFACDDGMRAGGVNVGGTRQLVHDLLGSILEGGWEQAVRDYGGQRCTGDEYGRFLRDLLDVRGEFGRLLLTLAAAVRAGDERDEAALGRRGGVVHVAPGQPPRWWEDPELAAPVVAQLRRCLEVLLEGSDQGREG